MSAYPETVKDLVDRCNQLVSKWDLYTLGEKQDPANAAYYPDGTQDLSGEYQYGVGMIPAQWVTNLADKLSQCESMEGE